MNLHENIRLIILGTHNMLEIARLFDIEKSMYTRTSAIYGAVPRTLSEDKYPPNL